MLEGVNLDLGALAAAANTMASPAVGWEMAVRLGQSLEITDGLWELVPVVVAAGDRVDERPAAQAADLSPAARGLGSGDRARLQALGDQFLATLDAAVAGQRIDEDALGRQDGSDLVTAARRGSPKGSLIDLPRGNRRAQLGGRRSGGNSPFFE
jgi:hypothetical protein